MAIDFPGFPVDGGRLSSARSQDMILLEDLSTDMSRRRSLSPHVPSTTHAMHP
jgi:hypothetical protein